MKSILLTILLSAVALKPVFAEFEAYQLNGGLVAAVAAKDFVVIASDTRFAGDGGYDILSRDHLESRLWMASVGSSETRSIPFLGSPAQNSSPPSKATTTTTTTPLLLPASLVALSSILPKDARILQSTVLSSRTSPTFVGSAGCNADCEALKRYVQADLRSAVYFGEATQATGVGGVDQVATLLSQMLYSRRGFPFYSFCVVGGLGSSSDSSTGGGQVYVYDAIGSYEQVAVASSGTGRELLQPILDAKFRTIAQETSGGGGGGGVMARTSTTVPTQVDCTPEEAVSILIHAYQSVSEREIGVGDNMVICVLKRRRPNAVEDEDEQSEGVDCTTFSVPLKQH